MGPATKAKESISNNKASSKPPTASQVKKDGVKKGLNPDTKAFVPQAFKATATEFHPPKEINNAKPSGGSAWGKKTNEAVLRATPVTNSNQNNNQSTSNSHNNRSKNNGNRNNHNHNNNSQKNNQNKKRNNKRQNGKKHEHYHHKSMGNIELLKMGDGNNDIQKSLQRFEASALLGLRLLCLDVAIKKDEKEADFFFNPPEYVLWNTPTRIEEIKQKAAAGSIKNNSSNSSQTNKNNTNGNTPEESVVPLSVNEETRWKARVFSSSSNNDHKQAESEEESADAILKKALLILNKLSFTKFEKLSKSFIDCGIFNNQETLTGAISIVVDKAQLEPHFSSMYAQLCHKLNIYDKDNNKYETKEEQNKSFRKLLLKRCQEEFEQNLSSKIDTAIEQGEQFDNEELQLQQREYVTALFKKKYLGHMRFIGELYKHDLISIRIMIMCLATLLKPDQATSKEKQDKTSDKAEVDEEKLECFAKLMTTIGQILENQCIAFQEVGKRASLEQFLACWQDVEALVKTKGVISNRIKFMLQDLIDLRKNGWVTRRKEETAKTLTEIHKEVAKEEKAKRSQSTSNLKALDPLPPPRRTNSGRIIPNQVDEDGFTTVVNTKSGPNNFKRNLSMNNMTRSVSDSFPSGAGHTTNSALPSRPPSMMKRSTSVGDTSFKKKPFTAVSSIAEAPVTKEIAKLDIASKSSKMEGKPPEECSKRIKSVLKEYIHTNDVADTILSIKELVGSPSHEEYKDRVVAIVETSTLQALEMKTADVGKYINLLKEVKAQTNDVIFSKENINAGLQYPLEILSDVIIDAPLASKHLSNIVANYVRNEMLDFDFLLGANDFFLTDSEMAATFAKNTFLLLDEKEKEERKAFYLDVIEKLLTETEKTKFGNASKFVFGDD